ncbi:porin [Pandoraea terrigena]|uniref:Outer membrane porin protein n=1 Tax=Pandoraea terrigena TaxID=2508292 RepID=A0A5E4VDP7_9BURK|nr:porin [Pandoraea terrigena]VVE10251.1 Outer membrane porin protein [Pandoraea terrigena]
MKNRIILAIFMLCASVSAAAQSSVTLYGVLDEALVYSNNAGGASVVQMLDSYHWNTMWGLKGTEDLGGGLKANFELTNYFNISNGSLYLNNSTLFYGAAWAGLSDEKWGAVTLGRHYDYSILLLSKMPGVNATFAQTPGNLDHTGGGYLDNAISYTSPSYDGFSVAGMYALPGGTSDALYSGRAFSLSATYYGARLSVAAVVTKINGALITPTLAGMNTLLGQGVTPFARYRVDSQNIYGISAQYRFTDKIVGQASFTDVALVGFGESESVRTASVSGVYTIAPDLKLTAGYQHSGLGSGGLNLYSLFLDKFLSKRTDIYVAAHFAQAGGASQSAVLFTLAPSSTNRQLAVATGVRHSF